MENAIISFNPVTGSEFYNMHNNIRLNQKFELRVNIKKDDKLKIHRIILDNKFIIFSFVELPFPGFVELRITVNIRQAEIIRRLLENIKVYE